VVYVANSSGDIRTTSAALAQAVEEQRAPLQVETFVWTHGPGRYVSDHVDHANHREQGQVLAGIVAAERQACPGRAVYLVGHSAGAAVVLAAAEALPPDCIERIVLLEPSVSCEYDLRPALRTARRGIDSFSSRRDVVQLGAGVTVAGTADRRWSPAAGRVGFCPACDQPCDGALYTKLREHPWDESVEWAGHHGGHFGVNQPEYTRAYILPLLIRGRSGEGGTCGGELRLSPPR
jgi:pimeloyl-ACP methyl ester carboxylesterase